MRPSPKSEMMLYHEGEWELEAHTMSSCSTHGYFDSWRDELLTPSQCWDSEISCFAHWCWSKPNVNYLRKSSYFCNEFHPSILIEKIWKFSISFKTNFFSNILSLKYSDFNFYWNRSSRTWFARAICSSGFWSKMSPGMSCSNGGDHVTIKNRGYGNFTKNTATAYK